MDEKSTKVIDDYTVRIDLTIPYQGFLGMLGESWSQSIVGPAVMEHDKDGDIY
jgi:ABC-type transport system substrate-binding protein